MLTRRQQYLASIASLLGGLDVDSFSDRLLLQKRMFFISMLGMDLGYTHTWYIRGPYSPALTKDAFEIRNEEQGGGQPILMRLPENVSKSVKNVISLFGDKWNNPSEMELLASLYYLAKTRNTSEPSVLAEKLTSLKGHYSQEDAERGIKFLIKQGLLNV